jgi:hypothetical protein
MAGPHWAKAVELAARDKNPTWEIRNCLAAARKKLEAVKAGKAVPVAPLGKGVKE